MLPSLAPGPFECPPDAPFALDTYTLRIAAAGRGLRSIPRGAAQERDLAEPHGEHAARALLEYLHPKEHRPVSLGILCKREEVEAVLRSFAGLSACASDIVILADGAMSSPRPIAAEGLATGVVRLASRPLAGDFAAQRNALQDLSRQDWMLQLDSDEEMPEALASALPVLAGIAEADGILSVGLPRRNLVDGVLSDVYPDVQYRLNRREVRFEGRVHERPVRPWQRSFLVPGPSIGHRLTRARVLSRSRAYEALSPGRGRTEEEAELLRPYRD